MRITVVIPSRNRSFQLMATIRTLQKLESGAHDVTYVIGADVDDPETVGMGQLLRNPPLRGGHTAMRVFERSPSLGAMVNQMTLDVPGDVYCSLCDDVLIQTEGWDQKIAEAVEAKPDGVFWWKTDAERTATYAIVTEKWRAAAGRIFTDYFPFWWDDLWLLHVWMMASEGPWLYVDAWLEDRPAHTHRMRDLRFWTEFYLDRTTERREEAERIRQALGWPRTIDPKLIEAKLCQLSPEYMSTIEKIETTQGDADKPPTPEYLRAKARAESIINQKEAA